MNATLDQVLVLATIAAALGFFVFRTVRSSRKKSCDSGCGCGAAKKAGR